MKGWLLIFTMALAALLTGCGSSSSSSTQAPTNTIYSVYITPNRLTLDEGDYASVVAAVDESVLNSTPKPISPQPTLKYYSSDSRVTISPGGSICAGQWDSRYMNCVATGTLPDGPVTVTAYAPSQNVSGTTQVWVHNRAARITLCAPTSGPITQSCGTRVTEGSYPSKTNCVSANNTVRYFATAYDATGAVIPNCADGVVAGCVNDLDYTWSTSGSTVAFAGEYGTVAARDAGVVNVYAELNGTLSTPLAFASCPPAGIQLDSSAFTKNVPVAPFSTADLTGLNKGSQEYFTTLEMTDTNGNLLPASVMDDLTLSWLSSDPLNGKFTQVIPLTAEFTATTSGRTLLSASCTPSNSCNTAVNAFLSPTGQIVTSEQAGFGYPVYSNVIGATIDGTTPSTVLVTGATFADGVTPTHQLLTYDTEALGLTHTVALANIPNSLVVAPNGVFAYVGSDAGLMVVSLSSYESSIMTYPIAGGLSTDVVTGKVLGVSHDSRYVIISDTTHGLLFLIDTTGTKAAVRYTLPGIYAATFASDGSNMWVAGTNGVYVYQSDAFIQTQSNQSSNVTALAWMPDGLSYFASGAALTNYTTCNDQNPQTALNSNAPVNLDSTALNGTPQVFGYSTSLGQWVDFSLTDSSNPAVTAPVGNVCSATVAISAPLQSASTLACTPTQFTFSQRLQQEFVTGVNPSCGTSESVLHAYDVGTNKEFKLTASTPMIPLNGGVLYDGRELYIGTWDGTSTAALHRFNLLTTSGTAGTLAEDLTPVSLPIVPSFVAVVPQ
jgi:hypothetical protein